MPPVRLFVYGSLKRGGLHHDELCGAPFLGEAHTVPGYALVPLLLEEGDGARAAAIRYSALIKRPEAGSVPGELFEVDEALLPRLDEFEGAAYRRAQVPVVFRGETGSALAYLAYPERTR